MFATILVPTLVTQVFDGYVEELIYTDHYIKNRCLAGFFDFIYFFLSILEGVGEAVWRVLYSFIGLLLAQV